MESPTSYHLLADAVLLLHVGIVVFVVASLPLIVVGNLARWRWVNARWFRLTHLGAIAVIVLQAWLGWYCALTDLESWLRRKAGEVPYTTSFVEYWLQRLVFHEAPFWVFTLAYTAFGLLVAWAWWYFPPRGRRRRA